MAPTPLYGRTFPDELEAQRSALSEDPDLADFLESRRALATDPYRPLFHFSPPQGSMNDPNGLCQWDGRFHLFYQFLPNGGSPDNDNRVHWGHTVSEDLIRWTDLPPALYPTTEHHCYSGQTLVEPDRVVAMYHGTESGNSIATATDPLLLNWVKHPANPVIPMVPIDADGFPYRVFDPCIWKEDDGYYAISGTYKDGGLRADCRAIDHLFRSSDLATWEHIGTLIEGGFHSEPGEDGAVPNFWPIGDGRHMMLFFSHKRAGQYYIGTYDRETHRLNPERFGRMNYGAFATGSLHAPSATVDDQGRYIGVFNVKEGRAGTVWTDVMTLPRHYWLRADGSLCMEPVEEVESLRGDEVIVDSMEIPGNTEIPIDMVNGKALEIQAVIDPGEAREVGIAVLRSPDGVEQTRISLLQAKPGQVGGTPRLQIDISQASLREDVYARDPEIGPLTSDPDDLLRLRVFVDRSVVEVFVGDQQCLTLRTYPSREDSAGVALFARGGPARLQSLSAWSMKSIWPELRHLEGC
tara:strand:- start:1564 stop:3132 length:1569 start_codon:yes stop_codon:yes gene_type:complete